MHSHAFNWPERALISFACLLAICVLLTACDEHPQTYGTKVIIQTVDRPVPLPCPVKKPVRPAKLDKPLPTDLRALVKVLEAKLLEYAGPGKYADQANDDLETCIHPPAPAK